MSKVNIISGFLGAGKTTFIKELITKVFAGQKVVLIENEFGEIGIDGSFLKESGIQINEMNSGCICCSLVGDFKEALAKVEQEFHPERIIIEPSGVGKLSDVEQAVLAAPSEANIQIEGKITVVDAKKAKKYFKNFGEFFANQVQFADTVVLSRTADITEDKLEECLHIIRELNTEAPVITTVWDMLDGDALNKALTAKNHVMSLLDEDNDEEECCCHHHHDDEDEAHEHHHHHHHHADDIFTSWGSETVHKYDRTELEQIIRDLAETEKYGVILRSKGILALTDGSWIEYDMVPEELEIRETSPDYIGRVVVIGTKLDEAAIKAAFHIA